MPASDDLPLRAPPHRPAPPAAAAGTGDGGDGGGADNPQSAIREPHPPNASLTPRPGHLYVVATPIGNLADLTDRARAILSAVDIIACEDTRTTGALIARLGLPRSELAACHDHNETAAAARLAAQIAAGKSVAIVSDAGTPAISDPGFRLVRACRRLGLPVVPVPGACALAAVLSAAGLPTNGFFFAGFLPPKASARAAFLEKYRDFEYTLVLYESCHRVDRFVAEITEKLGPARVICVAKEVTKLHETFLAGPAGGVRARLAKTSLKGEFTVLIAPEGFTL
ncbi:MAG: 16S rRNA (cytidine(1402)-2'-O)-methyltransferase [Opitutaceae bacterium]|jgi:16S rRNA (cytidine1402-2'-O)-methyltransferase|nr:16S rRNA (cytidine(1402)-2'-O)-methyltransferase [Opitutaceae bacterium]